MMTYFQQIIKDLALAGKSQMYISNYLNDHFQRLTFPADVKRILVHELGIVGVPVNEDYE